MINKLNEAWTAVTSRRRGQSKERMLIKPIVCLKINDTDNSFAFSCSYEKFYVAIAGYLKGYHAWSTFQKVWMQNMKVNVTKNEFHFFVIFEN